MTFEDLGISAGESDSDVDESDSDVDECEVNELYDADDIFADTAPSSDEDQCVAGVEHLDVAHENPTPKYRRKLLTRKRLVNSIDAALDETNFTALPPVTLHETHVGYLGARSKCPEQIEFTTEKPRPQGNYNKFTIHLNLQARN